MEPFKALTFIAATAVVSLVGAGAAGFYFGYTQARGDLEEIKAHLSAAAPSVEMPQGDGKAVVSVNLTPILEEVRALAGEVQAIKAKAGDGGADGVSEALEALRGDMRSVMAKLEAEPQVPAALLNEVRGLASTVDALERQSLEKTVAEIRAAAHALEASEPKVAPALLEELKRLAGAVASLEATIGKPIVDELRYLGDQIQAVRQGAPLPAAGSATTERPKNDPSITPEIAQLRQLLTTAADQFGRCQSQLATVTTAAIQPANVSVAARQEPASVVLYDNVVLKREEEKLYNDIGVRLSLESIAARQIKLAVNRQGVGLAFGERKVFRHQDVECELNLMETNLNDGEARVSISCKR